MSQQKNQAHFCQKTTQHEVVITFLLCLLRSHFGLDASPALPSSAGPWAKPKSASPVTRAGPDYLHPPWVGPPKLSWPSHCCKSTGEGGDPPWGASPGGRHSSNNHTTLHTVLVQLQPPSGAVLTAWNEGHHSSWRNLSCTHWLRKYLVHTLQLPILAACLRFRNKGGNQGNVTCRIFLNIKFMVHCWFIYNSSQIAMQIFG